MAAGCWGFFTAPFGKRSWKMFYCTLRDLVLYLHKDERGFQKNQVRSHIFCSSQNLMIIIIITL